MVGPPGTGKSMLAQRFVSLLPALDDDEALESAAVLSLTGTFSMQRWGLRVMRAPHHSASSAALVGGGSPPRPGEITLAHHGVLFLDELPEFPRAALEALREPLETGRITISRAARQADFPARFQLLAAMNPCPCGHLGSPRHACRCSPDAVARYQGRISGPLLDRIDLQVEVPDVGVDALSAAPDGEPSAAIASRVAAARANARSRQGCLNAQLEGDALDRHAALAAAGAALPADVGGAPRLVGAQLSPHPAQRAHDRRPGWQRRDRRAAPRRSDPVPARARAGLSAAGRGARVRPESRGRASRSSAGSGRSC